MADAMALALDYYMLTLAFGFTVRHFNAFYLTLETIFKSSAFFWLMPVPTMMIKEPLFSVMIAYAACLLLLNMPSDQLYRRDGFNSLSYL